MAIQLLGATRVADSDVTLGPRDRVILSALCVAPGQPVSAEGLADALWGEVPPRTWPKVVQGSIMRLRKALGPTAVETTAGGYRMTLADGQLDTTQFERRVARGREFLVLDQPERAIVELGRAVALWQGDPFPDLPDWDPARAEASRLREIRLAVDEDLIDAHVASGRTAEAVALAASLVAREPYRERRWWQLALAQYRCGRQAEALDTLRSARATLRDELGLDPSSDLLDLERRILDQDPGLAGGQTAGGGSRTTCPYRGLRPFDSDDADWFFGRGRVVAEAMRRIGEHRLLVVSGPSGSGKSSLVRAGLIPALARQGRAATVVTPGADSLAALAAARAALPADGVLVVDQLEEAFASTAGTRAAGELLDELGRLVDDGMTVVVTLRADHLGGLAQSPRMSALAERGLLLLTPMTEEELREAIEGPARVVGLILEPGLVDVLVREVAQAPGGLPLLSHALAETWGQREGAVMTVEGYRATGGITSAVARSADRLFECLSAEDRDVLRSVMLRLVVPTNAGEPIAARVPARVFAGSPRGPAVLDMLVRSRLVTTTGDSATLAHESVIRAWPRLRTWLDEDVAGQRMLSHLQVAADTWDTLGRPKDELYRGARLAAALEWRARRDASLTEVEEQFLDAGAAHADAKQVAQARAHALQFRRNRQLRGALGAVIALLALALIAGGLAGASARRAGTAATLAADEASRADAAAVEALAARLASTALAQSNETLSLLLARQAVATADNTVTQGALLTTLARARGLVGMAHPLFPPWTGTRDHQFSPDGRSLLVLDIGLNLLDTSTGFSRYGLLTDLMTPRVDYDVYPAGFIDEGAIAVASRMSNEGSASGERRLVLVDIDVATGDRVGEPQDVPHARACCEKVRSSERLRISPDGRTLVSVLEGKVRLWHWRGGRWQGPVSVALPGLPARDPSQDDLERVTYSADGGRAAVLLRIGPDQSERRVVAVVDTSTARLLGPVLVSDPDGGGVVHAALSPDGRRLLVGEADGRVQIRTLGAGVATLAVRGSSPATNLAWSSDGGRVALARRDGSTDVYSLRAARLEATLGGNDEASALAFVGANGLIRQGLNGTIARFDLASISPVVQRIPARGIAQLASAGGVLAVGRDDGGISLLDAHTLRGLGPDLRLDGADGIPGSKAPEAVSPRVTALAVLPDASAVVAADRAGHVRMWSLPGRRLLWSMDDSPAALLAVSPDGRHLAAVGTVPARAGDRVTTRFRVWDLATHDELIRDDYTDLPYSISGTDKLEQLTPTPLSIAFSPDSTKVAVSYAELILMAYGIDQRKRIGWFSLPTTGEPLSAVAFSSDSTTIVGTAGDSLEAWTLASHQPVTSSWIRGVRGDTTMAPSADGRWLVISDPASIIVVDRSSLRVAVPTLVLPSTGGAATAFALAAMSDGRMAVGTSNSLIALDMDAVRAEQAACRLAGRRLTRAEWELHLPGALYAPACP